MKIIVITQKIDADDALLGFFHTWVRKLAAKVDEIILIAQSEGRYNLPKNVTVRCLGKEKGRTRFSQFVRLQSLLFRLLMKDGCTRVFCHMCPEYALLAFPAARLAKAPVFLWYTHGVANSRLRVACKFSTRIITASRGAFPFNHPRLIGVGHGIDMEKFAGSTLRTKKEHYRILSVGRISPIKKHEVMIQAMAILVHAKKFDYLRFQLVGGVPVSSQMGYLGELKRLVAQSRLQSHVHFRGPVSYENIADVYKEARIFVSASQTGSLDKSVLEAMASGMPVLVSNPAFAEVLGDLKGLLMFVEDDPEDLANKLKVLLHLKRSRLAEIGSRLRAIVEAEHNLDGLIARLIPLFRQG